MFKFWRFLPKVVIERWKWNKDYEVYVSNLGHVRDENGNEMRYLTDGYVHVRIPNHGLMSLHRLVLLTWKPIKGADDLTVDHLDHNRRNNAVANLEWVTKEENWRRAQEDSIPKAPKVGKAAKKQMAKLIEGKNVRCYRKQYGEQAFDTIAEAAKFVKECDAELNHDHQLSVERITTHVTNCFKTRSQDTTIKVYGWHWSIVKVN